MICVVVYWIDIDIDIDIEMKVMIMMMMMDDENFDQFRPTSKLIMMQKPIMQDQVLSLPLPCDADSGMMFSKTT